MERTLSSFHLSIWVTYFLLGKCLFFFSFFFWWVEGVDVEGDGALEGEGERLFDFVFLVPMYSVCNQTDFAINMLPANCLASCSVASKMSHKAPDPLASIFCPIFRLFSTYSTVSLLTSINFWVFTSVVGREIVFVFTASRSSRIVRNSSSPTHSSHLSWSCT